MRGQTQYMMSSLSQGNTDLLNRQCEHTSLLCIFCCFLPIPLAVESGGPSVAITVSTNTLLHHQQLQCGALRLVQRMVLLWQLPYHVHPTGGEAVSATPSLHPGPTGQAPPCGAQPVEPAHVEPADTLSTPPTKRIAIH